MAGIYAQDGSVSETFENAGSVAGQSTAVTVVQIAMIAVIAAVFMMLAVLCIRTMAKRHGNLEKMKIQKVKLSHIKNYFTAPVIVGIVVCVMYMIMLEFSGTL